MRTKGSLNRSPEQILRDRVTKLEQELKEVKSDHITDMRIMWTKLRDRQKISMAQSTEIGKIIKHLKGRGLWPVK